jgi:glycosyltransferase involved in cell wall biosynthesis
MARKKKILFVHQPNLEYVSGVNIIISELLRLIPSIDTSIEADHLSFEGYKNGHQLLDTLAKKHKDISCIIGVNLHIEKDWDLSIKLADYYHKLKKPTYIYIHDYWPHHYGRVKFLVDKFSVSLLSSSQYIKNSLAIDGFKSDFVPVGVSLNNIELNGINRPRSSPAKKIIASSGRIVRRKRFLDIIKAFSCEGLSQKSTLYLRLLPSHVFSIDDDEKVLNELRSEIEANRITKNSIVIEQNPEEKHNYYKYDIYVCASDYEGFSMAPIEAAYTGCPPIISDIPAHQHIANKVFKERHSDFIYPVYDYQRLAHLLRDEINSGRRKEYIESNKNEIQKIVEGQLSLMSSARIIAGLT